MRRDWPPWWAQTTPQLSFWDPPSHVIEVSCRHRDLMAELGYHPLHGRLYATESRALDRARAAIGYAVRKHAHLPRPSAAL